MRRQLGRRRRSGALGGRPALSPAALGCAASCMSGLQQAPELLPALHQLLRATPWPPILGANQPNTAFSASGIPLPSPLC